MGHGKDFFGPLGVISYSPRSSNSGGGYGSLRGAGSSPADGSGDERPSQNLYPYIEKTNEFSEEEEDEFFQTFFGDVQNVIDSVSSKIDSIYLDPDPAYSRRDNATLVKNQRIRSPSVSEASIPVRTQPSISPIVGLYPGGSRHQAIGGTAQGLQTAPGSRGGSGSKYGYSRAPIDDDPGDFEDYFVSSFLDLMNKSDKESIDRERVTRARRQIEDMLSEIDDQL